ncbi:MAG: alpha-rhamnosidase [Clostridia bacterium]|nr:alpha-rhamnosidase [Clostridia bacterium]
MSKWIWYDGEYELFHSNKLHLRRKGYDFWEPPFWKMWECFQNVRFKKVVSLSKPEEFVVYGNGKGFVQLENGCKYPLSQPISLSEGEHTITVTVSNPYGLPCIFVVGDSVISDESWIADDCANHCKPVGCRDEYNSLDVTPETFNFKYQRIFPVDKTETNDGILYDFGKETFAKLVVENMTVGEQIALYYGESPEEALDTKYSYVRHKFTAQSESVEIEPYAFRYIFTPNKNLDISADYEYLPLEYKGGFNCSDPLINKIWQTAAYTFHLNSREFFLDGIKRDRWVWSGDAYQSYFINNYLFFDKDITKRTIRALAGKDVQQHINTIIDYTFYWIISIYDYYIATGDMEFVKLMYGKMKKYMDYCVNSVDNNGLIYEREQDWLFIDWANMDKTGAVCAEQMLYVKALDCFVKCSDLMKIPAESYAKLRDEVAEKTKKLFYDKDRKAFIDSFESGKNNITRHANIFALMFDIVDEKTKQDIIENVILNDNIEKITTPYFEFYELDAMCSIGNLQYALDMMRSYWGGMLKLGATTFWEEYKPYEKGVEHYGMYGNRFEKSLCHAWSSSPIYLFGRYFLGVKNTGVGYDSFEVCPNLGDLEFISGTVPVNGGVVSVKMDKTSVTVVSDKQGGTLIVGGAKYPIDKDIPLTVEF